jgi:hypothetical protein
VTSLSSYPAVTQTPPLYVIHERYLGTGAQSLLPKREVKLASPVCLKRIQVHLTRFEIITALKFEITVSINVAPCSLVADYIKPFRRTVLLHSNSMDLWDLSSARNPK